MTTETLLWLFPSVFMLHEFEEIIGFRPWWERNRAELLNRFPRTGQRLRRLYDPLSTSAFAFAVAEEFVLVSVLTFLSVRFGWTALFAGLVIAYLIHLGVHIGQWLVWRRYAPMIVTSLLTAPYALYVLYALNQRSDQRWRDRPHCPHRHTGGLPQSRDDVAPGATLRALGAPSRCGLTPASLRDR
jgi:hypothetical protein